MKRLVLLAFLLIPQVALAANTARDSATPLQVRNTAATSEAITFPTCTNAADTLGVICSTWGGATCSWTGNTPAGWTVVPSSTHTAAGNCYICYYELNPAGGSVTISGTASAANSENAFCYDHVNTTNPFDTAGMVSSAATTGLVATANAVTPSFTNDSLVAVFGSATAATTFGTLTNTTTAMSLWQATTNSSSGLADNLSGGTTSASGATTMTQGSSIPNDGFHMLLENTSPATQVTGSQIYSAVRPAPATMTAIALGTLTGLTQASCSSLTTGAVPGATCYSATVACPNTSNITVWLAVTQPLTPVGMIVAYGGLPGNIFPIDAITQPLVHDWASKANETTVQVAWPTDPTITSQDTSDALHTIGCRGGTVDLYAALNWGVPGHNGIMGFSEGSAMATYPLRYAGMYRWYHAALVEAFSPWGDHVQACTTNNVQTWQQFGPGGRLHPCGGISSVAIGTPASSFLDSSDHTGNIGAGCNGASGGPYAAADKGRWQAGTLANANMGTLNWGNFHLSVFECADFNVASAGGVAMLKQLSGLGIISNLECNWSGAASDPCGSEQYSPNGSASVEYTEMYNQLVYDLAN